MLAHAPSGMNLEDVVLCEPGRHGSGRVGLVTLGSAVRKQTTMNAGPQLACLLLSLGPQPVEWCCLTFRVALPTSNNLEQWFSTFLIAMTL